MEKEKIINQLKRNQVFRMNGKRYFGISEKNLLKYSNILKEYETISFVLKGRSTRHYYILLP